MLARVCSVPFYFRRRAPFAVLMVSTTSLVVLSCLDYQANVQSQMLVVAAYTVGAYSAGRQRASACIAWIAIGPRRRAASGPDGDTARASR